MTKPYVPFYKPLGMSDRTYRREVRKAEQRLAEWQQMQDEMKRQQVMDNLLSAINTYYHEHGEYPTVKVSRDFYSFNKLNKDGIDIEIDDTLTQDWRLV